MDFVVLDSKAKGKEDFVSIYARIRAKGMNSKYSLHLKIKRHEWQKFRTLTYVGSQLMSSIGMKYADFAILMGKMKAALEDKKLQEDPSVIPALIASIKAEYMTGAALPVPEVIGSGVKLLVPYMEKYIEDLAKGKRTKRQKSVSVSEGYISKLNHSLGLLKKYELFTHNKVTLDKTNMAFQRGFVAFLRNRGLKPNTINGTMSSIRVTIQAAYLDKKTKNADWMNPEFVPAGEETDNVFLNPEQIEQMRAMDLSSIDAVKDLYAKTDFGKRTKADIPFVSYKTVENMQKTRDIFIVGCLTGQRFSDYSRIGKKMYTMLKGKTFIQLRQKKTSKKIFIPVDKRVTEILDKYPEGQLPKISDITFNKTLKILGELLGWTWIPEFDRSDGSEDNEQRFCDMMMSHTARRSFATNAYAVGIPLSSIMAITGHSSEKNLRKYLKLQAEDKGLIAADDFEGFIQ